METKTKGDFFLLAILTILILFGCIMVFSSSYPTAIQEEGSVYFFFKKHVISIFVGLVMFFVASKFPVRWLKPLSIPIFIVAIVLICLTHGPMGVDINGARRWVKIAGGTIMPAEVVKFAAINLMVSFLTLKDYLRFGMLNRIVPAFAIVAVSGLLIYSTEDLSSSITLVLALCGLLFLGGLKITEGIFFFFAGSGAIYYLYHRILRQGGFRAQRLLVWKDPFSDYRGFGWQTIQSYYAFSLGGILGVGLGQSKQKFSYLPSAYSDFIFAIIGEELGLIGCIFVVLLFIALVWRGLRIATLQTKRYEMLLAIGITLLIGIQTLINICVTVGILPNTGIPLPFISHGGTSMMVFMGMAGILFNLSKNGKEA